MTPEQIVWALRVPAPPQTFGPSEGGCRQAQHHPGQPCTYQPIRRGDTLLALCQTRRAL